MRPSPALVIALIALFVSLGGTGYAALKVSGKNVKDASLTSKDVKNNSLTGGDIKNRSLAGKDFKKGQLPAGPKGATGAQGPPGAAAATAYAAVGPDGKLRFGKGATASGGSDGQYTVTFNRPIARCAIFATHGYGSPSGPGDNGSNKFASANPNSSSAPNAVNVRVYNGGDSPVPVSGAFFVALLC